MRRRTLLFVYAAAAACLITPHANTRLRAASTTIVISEFRTRGPSGGNDEFIEIRNVSSNPISLNGWSVIGSNGSGLTDVRALLPNVALGAGCTWLLGNSNTNGYTGPTNQTYAVGITDDGGIALAGPGGIVDQVGLSGGSAFGEGTRLPNFGSGNGDRSYERGGDTDNNAADFHLRAPSNPQTSGAACSAAPTPTNPAITSAAASPATVGAGNETLLTAVVTAGTNPASTGLAVSVTAAAIGIAGATMLVDDGTNGDAIAGDLVFSRRVTIAAGTAAGAKTLPVSVADAQSRSGSGSISLTVQAVVSSTPPTVTAASLAVAPVNRYMRNAVLVSVQPGTNPTSTGLQVVMNLAAFGGAATTSLSDAGGVACDAAGGDRQFTACFYVPATTPVGPLTLTGTVRDAQGRTAPVSITTSVNADVDTDADGLPDQCEATFGLNTSSGAGDNGSSGDPDGDGLTNAQECSAGTHPRGFFRRFLAEGVTNDFFQTRLALFNPSSASTVALVRIQPEGAPERSLLVTMPGQYRRTIMPEDTATLTSAPFATVIESDVELVVDRWMTWGAGAYGSHAETAVHAPSTTWYLAEGATGWRFSLFYLLQNPSATDAQVEISYLRPSDPVLVRSYTVPGRQRRTIPVDDEEFPAGSRAPRSCLSG